MSQARSPTRKCSAQADLCDLALASGSLDAVVSFYALGHMPSVAAR
jgi:hypothetical protein